MSYDIERQRIEQAYLDEMPVGAAVQWGNRPFQPPASGFTRISIISGGGSRPLGIGDNNLRRYSGVIDVAIFVPADAGTAGVREVARQVDEALAQRSFTTGTARIITFGADLTLIGRSGDWFQGNVSIQFQRDDVTESSSLRSVAGDRLFKVGGDDRLSAV